MGSGEWDRGVPARAIGVVPGSLRSTGSGRRHGGRGRPYARGGTSSSSALPSSTTRATAGAAGPMPWRSSEGFCRPAGERGSRPVAGPTCRASSGHCRPAPPTSPSAPEATTPAGRREGALGEPARSVAESLARIAAVREGSARDYRAMLDTAIGRGRASAARTVYAPRFPEPGRRRSNPPSLGRLVMVEDDEAGRCAGAPACPATAPPPLRAIPSGGTG